MGLRSLAQVLLGMLGFVLLIELGTSVASVGAVVGGASIGPIAVLVALIADVVAIVLVSRGRRSGRK